MHIRRLTPADAPAFRALRLAGLLESPSAFGSSHAEEKDRPLSEVAARLAGGPDSGVFGAFDGETLVGLAGLRRERRPNVAHKAFVWGMYVAPASRGKGIGRALLLEVLALAHSVPQIKQVNLTANARNAAAVQLYESAGFNTYGCERGAMLIGGQLEDEVLMSLRLADG
jgi:RimJ/RimL family protein N-acetyltransferase